VKRVRPFFVLGVAAAGVLVAGAAAADPPGKSSGTPPSIVASGANDVADGRATIGVAIAPRDLHTRVYAEYGPTASYGTRTPETQVPPGDDVVAEYRRLQRLEHATEYHFRWVLTNDAGEFVSPDQTFTTGATGEAGRVGAAVQGVFISIATKSGKVRFRGAGRHRFHDLAAPVGVRVGSVVDARHGKVKITSGLPDGTSQSATFYGGRFLVRQSAADGRVEAHLRGGSVRRCRSPSTATAARKHRKRRRIRSLWGSDSSGLYSTYGLNSVATVRGTRWLTVDRCDGTLTKVVAGSVVVRNRRTGTTRVVTAGQSYLARRR
jgi:hypothetical protein